MEKNGPLKSSMAVDKTLLLILLLENPFRIIILLRISNGFDTAILYAVICQKNLFKLANVEDIVA